MKRALLYLTTATAAVVAVAAVAGMDGRAELPVRPQTIDTVAIQAGAFSYRLPGEYLRANRPTDAPLGDVSFSRGFEMMKYQVSATDYASCVADGACKPADGKQTEDPVPVTGVDYQDAVDYADWLSARTGERWRLPTDAEWAFAAGERFNDEPLGIVDDAGNPAARWLARYRKEAGNAAPNPEPKRHGFFGMNSKGIGDMAGNVWDWTSTCYARTTLDEDGSAGPSVENCGVRVAGGKHRAYMSFFIRDGKSGGCAAGMAPHNLGIRLVRDRATLFAKIKALLYPAG